MITITMCGELADIFIGAIAVDVSSVAEVIAALRANFPSFLSYLYKATERGVNYQIKVGHQEIDETQLLNPISDRVLSIRIIPVIAGAGTIGKIIGGIALIGLGLSGIGFLGLGATQLVLLGGAMLLGGISSLFGRVKTPTDDEANGKKSLVFGGPSTTQQEGGRVPIAYGVVLCGLYVVNAKVVSYLTS